MDYWRGMMDWPLDKDWVNVATPAQYVAWQYLDGKRYPASIKLLKPAPMPWNWAEGRVN